MHELPPEYRRGRRLMPGEATAAGMPHLGVAVHRQPGHRDTTPQHQAGGQALPSEHRTHVAEKRPDSELKTENRTKSNETNKNGDGATIHAAIRRNNGADDDHVARKVTAARMQHPGVVVRRRPGQGCTTPQHSDSGRAIPADIFHRREPNMAG